MSNKYDETIADALALIALQNERNRLEQRGSEYRYYDNGCNSRECRFLDTKLNPAIRSLTDRMVSYAGGEA